MGNVQEEIILLVSFLWEGYFGFLYQMLKFCTIREVLPTLLFNHLVLESLLCYFERLCSYGVNFIFVDTDRYTQANCAASYLKRSYKTLKKTIVKAYHKHNEGVWR